MYHQFFPPIRESRWMLYALLIAQYVSPVQLCWYGWVVCFMGVLLGCLILQCCSEYETHCRKKRTIEDIRSQGTSSERLETMQSRKTARYILMVVSENPLSSFTERMSCPTMKTTVMTLIDHWASSFASMFHSLLAPNVMNESFERNENTLNSFVGEIL